MTWIITRELNLFCNPEEIFDFFWQALLVCGLVRFRIFQGYSLFSYQCSLLFSATLIYYHNHLCLSTTFLFYFVHHLMSERRRRDLNPRAAINDLHPFQGCPFGQLGYFSEYITRYLIRSLKISNSIVFLMSGEDGIRTHVTLPSNWFRVSPVMTTSIPLHIQFAVISQTIMP